MKVFSENEQTNVPNIYAVGDVLEVRVILLCSLIFLWEGPFLDAFQSSYKAGEWKKKRIFRLNIDTRTYVRWLVAC